MSKMKKATTHRCEESVRAHQSIRFQKRHNIINASETWCLNSPTFDAEWGTTYLRTVCAIRYCPFCGLRLPDDGDIPRQRRLTAERHTQGGEPSVLSLKELRSSPPDCMYLETNNGRLECVIQDIGESGASSGTFVYGYEEAFVLPWESYGSDWRCWTARPTDEQRDATPWE